MLPSPTRRFREAIVAYYREMERLAVVLEEIMAEAL
jgi:hypothetical protein